MSMDSATSESFQSSNGGGGGGGDFDDFDSRAQPDSISSFLNSSPPQPSRSLFNPFPSHHTPSFLSDLDAVSWPPPPPPPALASTPTSVPTTASLSAVAPRSSKKRARASRRAPTTVLTTDTSNFRAMVQEFTGIPAPPFASSSSFSRPRLDLLHSAAAAATAPAFLLRPFTQKLQAAAPSASITGISSNTLPTNSSIQNQNFFFNSQDPVLNLQSMLQEQQRAVSLCQWPASGYAGGELGSVIAGASSVDTESKKRTGNCKSDHTGSSHAEKQPPEGFSAAAAARGEGGVDAWQLSSE